MSCSPNSQKLDLLHTRAPTNIIHYFHSNHSILEILFLEDPDLQDDIPTSYLSHKEIYEHGVAKACKVFKKIRVLQDEGKGGVDNFM